MSVINTNITSMIAQKNLGASQSALTTAMERLSSGMRINSAKDDAAGQAIANRMSSQITGLSQAQRNANDGISVAQTAEGALNQVNDNLQRIRELSVQAANDTNSPEDRASIQAEINQRLEEIDRISQETNFNGTKVLNAEQTLNIQVGANDGESISINLKEINKTTLGLASFDVTNTLNTEDLAATATTELAPSSRNLEDFSFTDNAGAATWAVYVDDANPDQLYVSSDGGATVAAATYNTTTNALEFDSSTAAAPGGTVTAAAGQEVHVGDGVVMQADDITGRSDDNVAAQPTLHLTSDGNYHIKLGADTYVAATVDFAAGTVSYDSSAAADGTLDAEVGTALDQISNPDPAVTIDTSGLDTSLVGDSAQVFAMEDGSGYVVKGTDADGNDVYYEAEVDTATGAVTLGDQLTADPLAALDNALKEVDTLRSDLGAIQNRFDSAITNLKTNETNLSAARSRIEDADYAVEVANMTKAQILQQAGTSVLAQANQIPQSVLSLLG
ncbi:FliC/FljB family flagellin [Azotobacter chroococcum subsp. isscasi]|uniref:FliC/FljB family flagellin n=1 Tax=Azotobacter chroococcum TaxID=353 RepID=UPI00103D8B9C|nr:FliC/FljB family flagellin [Azotobacter chroococcum]TBW12454.1 FliC/FljB family flagellin [Azotobacter chroococcum subsp. isscasi]